MPRTWKRFVGTLGFSSTFIFPIVARPSNCVASSSMIGAMRRHGPHHSAQKSTNTTPVFVCSSKSPSVNVFTLSEAIRSSPSFVVRSTSSTGTLVDPHVLPCSRVPGIVLAHASLLNAPPRVLVFIDVQRQTQGSEQRPRCVLLERESRALSGPPIVVANRIEQAARRTHERHS